MMQKDPRVDAYIDKSADFARPILVYFRELMHELCPGIKEKIKWEFPNFEYKGSTIVSMTAFEQHCAITFRDAHLIKDLETKNATEGSFGRITRLRDLPSKKKLRGYLKEAMALHEPT